MIVISKQVLCFYLLAMPTVIFLAEAWLEVIVLQLKYNPPIRLDQQEHFRSGVLACLVLSPFVACACLNGLYWLLPALLVNRRMVFDPALKLLRKPCRRLYKYEGTGPVDAFCTKIFGRNGAGIEISLELAATAGCLITQLYTL